VKKTLLAQGLLHDFLYREGKKLHVFFKTLIFYEIVVLGLCENCERFVKTEMLFFHLTFMVKYLRMKNTMNYKDYTGTIEFSEKEMEFYGRVVGMRTSITYRGASAEELVTSFHNAIDTYIETSEANGQEPDKPFKGSFNVRVSPQIHKECVEYATNHDISLNTLVNMALRQFLVAMKR